MSVVIIGVYNNVNGYPFLSFFAILMALSIMQIGGDQDINILWQVLNHLFLGFGRVIGREIEKFIEKQEVCCQF